MTDISKPMLMRGAILAAAGILVGTLGQASLTDFSRCRRATDADLSVAIPADARSGDAPRRSFSDRDLDGARQACAPSDMLRERARTVEPDFLRAVEIASGARSASN